MADEGPNPRLFQALGVRTIDACDKIQDVASWAELLACLEGLDPVAADGLRLGVSQVLLRAVETAILGAKPIVRVSEFWDSLRGQVDEQISERIKALIGETPEAPLIRFIRSCLQANVLQSDRKALLDRHTVARVFAKHRGANQSRRLRCTICGFHFRKCDLSPARRKLALMNGFVFARQLKASRMADRLKPSTIRETAMHLDHIIPEAAHGGTDPDNLQITCAYCNRGRKYYWRSLEGLSMFVSGSLAWMPSLRVESRGKGLRHAACVAAYQWNKSRCSRCGASSASKELAVSPPMDGDPLRFWGVPWKLRVQCYACRAHAREGTETT
jgi:hypothetical protein